MTVISSRPVNKLRDEHPDAADELAAWLKVAKKERWQNFADVRRIYTDADQIEKLLVFNIRHNKYRLIVKVDFASKLIMVKELLSHKEYDKGAWKKKWR